MLRPRLIPCLLIHRGGLVKTVRFSQPKYVGDPLNAVRIFNEKEVDELIVLDIDATAERREPNYQLVAQLAAECRMPLCYGGGITTSEQVERLISLGVEKVALGHQAVNSPELITNAAKKVGSQSIVAVIDVKSVGRFRKHYSVFTLNGTIDAEVSPLDHAIRMQSAGAGEILLNSIDRDGTMEGYDHALVDQVLQGTNLPMTVMGGASSLADVAALNAKFGTLGAAAGSIFVFKGRFRAVLIQYPSSSAKRALWLPSKANPDLDSGSVL